MLHSDMGEVMLQSTLYTKQFKFVFLMRNCYSMNSYDTPGIFRREENILGFEMLFKFSSGIFDAQHIHRRVT